ncbi:mitochondrial inner membrane protease ATP23 homolog [Thrips palmi]|uniref:Mitochondrial inner membrane protease ATP23 n=1 Tax=Thrips palmi TaxID=161013 RepID=A0A6P9A550_THRPL|nr:mitochondrial inner membrane protease ATP23 homolog [Thrips palmi]
MEIWTRLKAWVPTVLAAQPDTNAVADLHQNQPQGDAAVEVNGDGEVKETEKRKVDLSIRPENFTDILVDREGSYEYFPERKERYKAPVWKRFTMTGGLEGFTRASCEKKLYKLMKEEPLIKLLIGALETSGCPINIRRNFSCEVCYTGVCGGYDTETQQIVMCMNNVKDEGRMATILAHELIHMFDHCVNETNFKSAEHLACTEIRAINLTSCSLIDSFFGGYVSTMDLISKGYGKKHAICVKDRALNSVLAASSNLSEEDARRVIDKVFPHCYNDLEPIGRRLRHKTTDNERAYKDGKHYGYV